MISIQFLESRNNNRAINNLNRESFFSEREEAQAEKKFFLMSSQWNSDRFKFNCFTTL